MTPEEKEIARLNQRMEVLQQRFQFLLADKRREFPAVPEINMHSAQKWVGRNAILTACLYKVGSLFWEIAKNMEVPEGMRGKAAQGFQLCEAAVLETGGMPIPQNRLRILLADDLGKDDPRPE
jgi:hypothetical protein